MKCTIDNKYLPSLRELASIPDAKPESSAPQRMPQMLRVAASGKVVTLLGPDGEATLPSHVERSGVLFVPAAAFFEAVEHLHTKYWIHVEATTERVRVNDQILTLREQDFSLFDDPEKAPATWCPLS